MDFTDENDEKTGIIYHGRFIEYNWIKNLSTIDKIIKLLIKSKYQKRTNEHNPVKKTHD